jgi:hypothetical protein
MASSAGSISSGVYDEGLSRAVWFLVNQGDRPGLKAAIGRFFKTGRYVIRALITAFDLDSVDS